MSLLSSSSSSSSSSKSNNNNNNNKKKIKLNDLQEKAIDIALQGDNLFLTGSAGTGKSKCLSEMVERLKENNKRVEITATTGIAAVGIGGVTIHSFAGFGIGNETVDELKRKAISKKFRDIWQSVDTLIIDEISMMQPDYFEKLSLVAQTARESNAPFGGVQMIAVGDFFQLPPVTKKIRGNIIPPSQPIFCFETALWKDTFYKNIELKQVFRQSDPTFVKCLQRIRCGEVVNSDTQLLFSRLNAIVGKNGITPTFLHSRAEAVNDINQKCLASINAPQQTYYMVNGYIYPKEAPMETIPSQAKVDRYVTDLKKNVPAEAELHLKIGAQVILLVNLAPEQPYGLVNGSRGVVCGFTEQEPIYPIVQFAKWKVVIRGYMWKKIFREKVYAYVAQIPLKLAYAYTIHKSQSQSLDCVKIQLDVSIFDEGQAYTALSRVRTLDGLSLSAFDPACIKANPRVIKFYNTLNQNVEHILSQIASSAPTKLLKDDVVVVEEEEEEAADVEEEEQEEEENSGNEEVEEEEEEEEDHESHDDDDDEEHDEDQDLDDA